jgi:hypothetical protein
MDPTKLSIQYGWLVYETGEHTCAGGTPESNGAHESSCGYEPLIRVAEMYEVLTEHFAQQAAERAVLADEMPADDEVPW